MVKTEVQETKDPLNTIVERLEMYRDGYLEQLRKNLGDRNIPTNNLSFTRGINLAIEVVSQVKTEAELLAQLEALKEQG